MTFVYLPVTSIIGGGLERLEFSQLSVLGDTEAEDHVTVGEAHAFCNDMTAKASAPFCKQSKLRCKCLHTATANQRQKTAAHP